MSYVEDTRSAHRSITIDTGDAEVEVINGLARIQGLNGLTYVCIDDDILRRSEGELGRVSVSESLALLTSQIEQMSGDALVEFIRGVSEDRGPGHSGILSLHLTYNNLTSKELAGEVLAHHFDVGEGELLGLSVGNIFRNISNTGADRLLKRLERNDRLEIVRNGLFAGLKQDSTHLLSNRKILIVK